MPMDCTNSAAPASERVALDADEEEDDDDDEDEPDLTVEEIATTASNMEARTMERAALSSAEFCPQECAGYRVQLSTQAGKDKSVLRIL